MHNQATVMGVCMSAVQGWNHYDRKIPIISPGLIFVQKAFCWARFSGSSFLEVLVVGGNFAFKNGWGLTIKTA